MRNLIEHAQHIVIFTHMAPDGDAMGSALALYNWIKSLPGISPEVNVMVPNAFPAFYQWMPGAKDIQIYEQASAACDALIAAADLSICTDFNDPKRIGPMGEKMMENRCPKVLIDHHPYPTDFANEMHSHPEVSSSCEVVYQLIGDSLKNELTAEASQTIATCIYTGLMTDTGNFSFNSTRAELYDIIAALLRLGIEKDAIYNAVFNLYSEDRVRLTGYALHQKMHIYEDYHLALITLSIEELEKYHYQVGDTEGLVNMPLQISDVYYSVFMREERAKPGTPKNRIRISFRSQGDRPVNIWAGEVFHGGGHANASGGELFGTLDQAVRLFEQTFPKYIKK